MYFLSFSLLFIAPFCFLKVNGQTTQTVQVGLEGSFFDPSYVVAQVGDIISFVFSGNIHTVTQSTFEDPCVALPGGFNSGLAGKGSNGTAPVPLWNLQITNASAPIWYFCQATVPSSHCAAGMVGVINPPNVTIISQFQSAARAVSGTPVPTFAVTLSGVGAFATASPSQVSTMPPPSPSGSSTVSSSLSAPESTTSAASPPSSGGTTSNLSAIIGGAVGGALGLIFILVILIWVLQQRKSKRRSVPPSRRDDFDYTPKQPTNNSGFLAVRNTEPDMSTPGRPNMGQSASLSSLHTLPPPGPRRPQFAPAQRPTFDDETPRSTVFSQTQTISEQQSNVNIQSLAHEVAAVLLQNPGLAAGGLRQFPQTGSTSNVDAESSASGIQDGRRPEFHVQNRDDRDQDHRQGVRSPPPHYHTAVGSSGQRPPPREK